ncbi:glycosyltransferase family A protein [Qingshengfaniella alkalisoli]|uniref:Glycosyltransferase family 2 protein n=1 Tax=Qingshengfaniella alkalisoli TaxID=2599296 RepID=A0A5B8J0R1_9RHOB|nr:glycosyltransferase family A protein [Qingshengfaniella alkalisoli]QDY70468.1 glycosyltransferase family 2 protein [Qingshengfaniella alkalisoli]
MSSFDIVIPNYNYGRYLRACVESVLSQDVSDLRVLIIDNASTDESSQIAKTLANADSRVEIRLRDRNLGPHASFNEGIDWARSDYFLILCSDDMLMPGALRRAGEVLDSDPAIVFCHGRDLPVTSDDFVLPDGIAAERAEWRRISGRDLIASFCRLGVFQLSGATLIVRTSSQKAAGYYREELPHSDDYDLWLRLALLGDVAALENTQAIDRQHPMRRSGPLQQYQLAHIVHTEAAANCFFTHEGAAMQDSARLHRKAQHAFTSRAYWSAISTWSRGDQGAADLMRFALGRRPLSGVIPPFTYLLGRPDRRARIRSGVDALFRRIARPGN